MSNLRQHEKWAHGEGFISPCSAMFDWSDSRNEHQVDCDECKAKKKAKLNQPKNQQKLRKWKKSIAKDEATNY